MKIASRQIKGKGRGKLLGFPTINLEIPEGLNLTEGIWAAWVSIGGKRYKGAMHYGPIPTFAEASKSLEVFLLDATDDELLDIGNQPIDLEPVKRLRDIVSFETAEELSRQIAQDVEQVRTLLEDTTIG